MTDVSLITYTLPCAGAVARTLADHLLSLPLNVKDFGATGNGVTDDTAAIQAALEAARTTSKHVYIPAGDYLVSDTLVLGNNMTVEGAGFFNTHIWGAQMNEPIFASGAGSSNRKYNCRLAHLHIQNLWAGQTPANPSGGSMITGSVGVFLENTTLYAIDRVLVNACDVGFKMYGNSGHGTYYSVLSNCTAGTCNTGLLIDSNVTGSEVNSNTFIHFQTGHGTAPIQIKSGNHNTFIHPMCEATSAPANFIEVFSGVEDVMILNPRTESLNHGGTGIKINSGAIRTMIMGGHFSNVATAISNSGTNTLNIQAGAYTPPEEEPSTEPQRYFILEKENGAGGGHYHTDLELWDAGGKITLTSGMVTNPNGGLSSFSASALVDGNTSVAAFHTDYAAAGTRIVVDFGAGNERLVTKARLHVNGAVVASWKGISSANGTTGGTTFTGLNCAGGAGWKEND